jgi:hypothetical protein
MYLARLFREKPKENLTYSLSDYDHVLSRCRAPREGTVVNPNMQRQLRETMKRCGWSIIRFELEDWLNKGVFDENGGL